MVESGCKVEMIEGYGKDIKEYGKGCWNMRSVLECGEYGYEYC